MATTRQKKVARELQREISQLLQREVEEELRIMLTVNEVTVTADLQIARVYFTCLPEKHTAQVTDYLDTVQAELRYQLARRMKNQLRYMPNLEFYPDETQANARKLEGLLEEARSERLARLGGEDTEDASAYYREEEYKKLEEDESAPNQPADEEDEALF